MQCKNCKTTKLPTDFYVSNQATCKDCVKKSVTANRIANIEHYRAFDRMRASMPHRVAARKEYQSTPDGRASHTKAIQTSRDKFPNKASARNITASALRDGKLTKTPCHICGVGKVEGHHPDYSRPLDVVWLCNAHHRAAHKIAIPF